MSNFTKSKRISNSKPEERLSASLPDNISSSNKPKSDNKYKDFRQSKSLKKIKIIFDDKTDLDNSEESKECDDLEENNIGSILPMMLRKEQKILELMNKVIESKMPSQSKEFVIKRIQNSDIEKPKIIEWVENVLSIPFQKYSKLPVTSTDDKSIIRKFFDQAIINLNNKVYGMKKVKSQFINYLAQIISTNNKGSPRTIALYGGPGQGKTHVIRTALAEMLGRPLRCINMGGLQDPAHFIGFDYSYSNASNGVLAQILIDSKVMDPIICFEEIDKVSNTKDGIDIQNMLIHLTDPVQNMAFHDKYFSGIDIDFSKAILVFTLNDPKNVNPILINRLSKIKVPAPTIEDKIIISKKFIIPDICSNTAFNFSDIIIKDDIIRYIITSYCKHDDGLRTLKDHIQSIILKCNTIKLLDYDPDDELNITFPFKLTKEIVDIIIPKSEDENDTFYRMYN
jgi:ATP-dependent Lon protease